MKNEASAAREHSPLLGFNNNVRHKGRLFHIQTEDSGVRHARITTHLFADGGRIIKTLRTDYSEYLKDRDLVQRLRDIMKAQHRSMFTSLRRGDYDQVVIGVCGAYPEPESETVPNSKRYAQETSSSPDEPPPKQEAPSCPDEPPAKELASTKLEAKEALAPAHPAAAAATSNFAFIPSAAAPISEARVAPAEPQPAPSSKALQENKPKSVPKPKAPRPRPKFGLMPGTTSQSLFGDDTMREKSLDEVILSYLADELADDEQ